METTIMYTAKIIITPLGAQLEKIILQYKFPIKNYNFSPEDFNVYISHKRKKALLPISINCIQKNNENNYVSLIIDKANNLELLKLFSFDSYNFRQKRNKWHIKIQQIKDIYSSDDKVITKETVYKLQHIENPILPKFTNFKYLGISNELHSPIIKSNSKHPLIIFLHGAGEGGNNRSHLLADRAVSSLLDNNLPIDSIKPYIWAPQAPTFWIKNFRIDQQTFLSSGKDYTQILVSILKFILSQHNQIDKTRIYVIGSSMGGYQALKLISSIPNFFAAGIISCPAKIPEVKDLDKLRNTPLWFIHSILDKVVPVSNTEYIVSYLRKVNQSPNNPICTYYKKLNIGNHSIDSHCVFLYTYENIPTIDNGLKVYDWLIRQRKDVNYE